MSYYRKEGRWIFLFGGLFVAGGLQLFISHGADFPQFVPIGIALLAIIVFCLPKRVVKVDVATNTLLISEIGRSVSISIKSITEVFESMEDIRIRAGDRSVTIYHTDFNNWTEEREFLMALEAARNRKEDSA